MAPADGHPVNENHRHRVLENRECEGAEKYHRRQ